ncbi:MAG: hypothetical protein FJ100_18835 [Deltaproteobacteria bacterium]|nr:hypothetical protein [Deltaproteobacteria bacterium]
MRAKPWIQRWHGTTGRLWVATPDPLPLRCRSELQGTLRRVLLPPLRAGLAPDPAAWKWSTLGDTAADSLPWVPQRRLARALAPSERGCADWFQSTVVAEPAAAPPAVAAAPAVDARRIVEAIEAVHRERTRRQDSLSHRMGEVARMLLHALPFRHRVGGGAADTGEEAPRPNGGRPRTAGMAAHRVPDSVLLRTRLPPPPP